MSDVEKAISGRDGNAIQTTTTTSATTAAAANTATAIGLPATQAAAAAAATTSNAEGCGVGALTATTTTTTAAATTTTTGTHNSRRSSSRSWSRSCVSLLLKLLFSTPGLVLLVCAYSVLGALIFPLLEAPQDITKSAAIAKSREDCLRELWIITEKLNVLYERNWTMLVHEQLRRFEGSIVAATRQGVNAGGYAYASSSATSSAGAAATSTSAAAASGMTALGRFGGNYDSANGLESWSFSEALLYSVTVITTIGHGSLTPKTAAGKIATIFYALIGVPLMLMCLSSLGALLADALQCTYARLCCQLQASMGRGAGGKSGGVDKTAHKRRCSLDNAIDGQSQNGLNCKNCKYDALSTETSLTNGYEFGSKRKLSLEHSEDACQLLRCNAAAAATASPAKSSLQQQQGSPCMQIKMATAQGMPYYQQRQQQQQQQQPPDVMLMATAGGGPATNPMATPTMQQKFACTRSATPSPQHLQHQQQQQQQQQFYITTTNATPTTLPRMHHQHQQQQQQLSTPPPLQQQQQQHFVAVPSSILRFSLASATPMPPNCYTTPGGAATIYFPIATSAGSGNNSMGTMPALPPPPQPQQLVKYHTIQLQPAATKRLLAAGDVMCDAPPPTVAQASSATMDASIVAPLPPPPAYQTATVHGLRRAKFLTKPLPHELTMLANGSGSGGSNGDAGDGLSCRHDLLHNALTTTTATTTMNADNGLIAAGVCGALAMPATTSSASALSSSSMMPNAAAAPTTTITTATTTTHYANATTVDIMDEEDENEQQRISNCPHGTPSRVPLIGSSKSHNANASTANAMCEADKTAATQARSLLNATAASFHRHTLHPHAGGGIGIGGVGGQRGKSHLLITRRGCQMHARGALYDSAATTETDDDDDEGNMYMQHGSEQFVLKKLKTRRHATRSCSAGGGGSSGCVTESEVDEDADNDDDDDDDDGVGHATQRFAGAQVPISVVLLILVCYISVGTFIFAFWENWSLVDGAYFCFVTLSTIGYGDFVPTRTFQGPELQLYACCAYLLLGLVLVAMSFSILETQLMWKCKRIAVRLKLAKD